MLAVERAARRVFQRRARFEGEWGRVNMEDVNRERFSVGSGVTLPDGAVMDGSAVMSAVLGLERHPRSARRRESERVPVVRDGMTERIPLVCREGVSVNAGRMALAVLFFVFSVLFLLRMSDMTETSKDVSDLQREIAQVQKASSEIEASLAAASSDASVGYEAAKRGMISAKGVDVVYVTAPATRTGETTATEAEVPPAHSEFFATLLGQ